MSVGPEGAVPVVEAREDSLVQIAQLAGRLSLSEDLARELSDKLTSGPSSARDVLISTGLELINKGLSLVATDNKEVQEPNASPSSPVLVEQPVVPAMAEVSGDQEGQATSRAISFIKSVLDLSRGSEDENVYYDSIFADMTQATAMSYTGLLLDFYREGRMRSKRYRSTIEQRCNEVVDHVNGMNDQEIMSKYGREMSATALPNNRKAFIKTVHQVYAPDALRDHFKTFIGGETASDIIALPAAPAKKVEAEPVVQAEESADAELDIQDLIQECQDYCAQFWTEEDLISLKALFKGETGGQDERARVHLAALMTKFMPFGIHRQGPELLEFDVLNRISGFHLQQGQKPSTLKMAGTIFRERLIRNSKTVEVVLVDGINKLVAAAQDEYEKDWYPKYAVSAMEPANQPTVRPEELQTLTDSQHLITELLHTTSNPATEGQVRALDDYLMNPEAPRPTNGHDLRRGVDLMRKVVERAFRKDDSWRRQRVQSRAKDAFTPTERHLLKALVGSTADGSPSHSCAELCQTGVIDALKLKDAKELTDVIYDALKKTQHIVRG